MMKVKGVKWERISTAGVVWICGWQRHAPWLTRMAERGGSVNGTTNVDMGDCR